MTESEPRSSDATPAGVRTPIEARVTIALFTLALTLWAGLTLVLDPGPIASFENRYLAKMPSYGTEGGGFREYVAGLEDYLDDHLAFREPLIRFHARFKVGWLGGSPSAKLIVGKNGWFFVNDPTAVAQYRGLARFTPEQLETWKRVLEERRDWLAERGIAFMLVLAPNKHQIYPEFMPDSLPRVGIDEQHAQLARYLRERSNLHVVDLMPAMLEGKKKERIYHKTDTHWNDVGAYLAYQKILQGVGVALPEFSDRLHPVKVKLNRYTGRGIGLTSLVGLSDVYTEEVPQLLKLDPLSRILMGDKRRLYAQFEREQKPLAHGVPGARLPSAVVFRDSFSSALIPYLSENFRHVLYVWTRDVMAKYVEREQPDIVIQQIAGRVLDRTPMGMDATGAGSAP